MPTVVNGIGTWYYGKRSIQRNVGVCRHCQRVGELSSYDTTHYFVVFFVPLIPLGAKRIIEDCPYCRQHGVMKLKQWHRIKAESFAELSADLQNSPNSVDVIVKALALPVAYQDEKLFDQVTNGVVASGVSAVSDPAVLNAMGHGYAYFARHAKAEQAYRTSLAIKDDPDIRDQLAMTLLRQQRPHEAEPLVQYVLDERIKEKSWLPYFLVEGYQAEGKHAEALAILDKRDEAFPELAKEKDHAAQRAVSEKNRTNGKKIKSAFLSESKQVGYREGNWTARVPKLIGPALALGAAVWYLVAAIWIGNSRKVYFVNGASQAYKIRINGGDERNFPPGFHAINVPEGEVSVEFANTPLPLAPVMARIETPLWSRPFARRTFVVNPDRLAMVVHETAVFAINPPAGKQPPPPSFRFGEALYAFDKVDYEFSAFPQNLKMKRNDVITKTRVGIEPVSDNAKLQQLNQLDDAARMELFKNWISLDPDNRYALSGMIVLFRDPQSLELLRPALSLRPLRIDVHRSYQEMSERLDPKRDLVAEYRAILNETKEAPAAKYLLGRILDGAESEQLLQSAATAKPPETRALQSLGFHAMILGDFPSAVAWYEKSLPTSNQDTFFNKSYHDALLAAGRYEQLLKVLSAGEPNLPLRLRAYAGLNQPAAAEQAIEESMRRFPPELDANTRSQVRATLDADWCCAKKDVAGFLKFDAQRQSFRLAPAQSLILQAKLKEAMTVPSPHPDQSAGQFGLIWLAATKAKDIEVADLAWTSLLEALGKRNKSSRRLRDLLSNPKAESIDEIRRQTFTADDKRIFLAVAARKLPGNTQPLITLAKQLNFQRDVTSLCLEAYWKD